jgi:hypothetical protein
VVEAALKEMETEMQLCHGTHHHPEHSNDQGMEKLDLGWETCEYKND